MEHGKWVKMGKIRMVQCSRNKRARWKEHFEALMNVHGGNVANVNMIGCGSMQRLRPRGSLDISMAKEKAVVKNVENGKAASVDEVTAETI